MIAKSAMAAAHDVPMSDGMRGKCNGCAGDEKGVAPTACSALCSPMIAAPLVAVVLYAVPVETLSPTAGPHAVGRTEPPDPYPPRPISMS